MYAKKIDLRPWAGAVKDQGSENACVTFGFSGLLEDTAFRAHATYTLPPMPWYEATLAYENRTDRGGLIVRDALTVGKTMDLASQPGTQSIVSYRQVTLNPDSFAGTLASFNAELEDGHMIAVAFRVPKWFFSISGPMENHDILDTTQPDYTAIVSNHLAYVVGRDSALNGGSYIFKNSYGTSWGDGGYFALSYTMSTLFFEAYVIEQFAGLDFRYTPEREAVAELYVSLFNRAPELSGLDYWAGQLSASSLQLVAQQMYDCAPSRAYYPSDASNAEIIASFYRNVLGRDGDAEGLAYWTGKLDAGCSEGQVITEMIAAVEAYNGSDEMALTSQRLFENKVDVGMHYAITLQAEDLTVAQQAFNGVTADVETVGQAELNLSYMLGWL